MIPILARGLASASEELREKQKQAQARLRHDNTTYKGQPRGWSGSEVQQDFYQINSSELHFMTTMMATPCLDSDAAVCNYPPSSPWWYETRCDWTKASFGAASGRLAIRHAILVSFATMVNQSRVVGLGTKSDESRFGFGSLLGSKPPPLVNSVAQCSRLVGLFTTKMSAVTSYIKYTRNIV
ncbi:hypothetical protein LZ32DRAFT_440999 [Colletotrichum eremochloae]|nr:hypothetical protein LZ32DRAFT_440999 [Colletotrichum eremochloae]